jgi:hypothetical protein
MSLLDKASLIVTPNAYKTSKLYSVVPNTTLGDMDVVRGTTATRINSAGLIESVGVNIPRIDYTNASCPSILVEPLRTNLMLRSEDIDNASWTKEFVSSSNNNTLSPSGVLNASKIFANSTSNISTRRLRATSIAITSGVSYSVSFFVKKAQYNFIHLRYSYGGGDIGLCLNMNTFAVTQGFIDGNIPTSFPPSYFVVNYPNGWVRVVATFTAPSTTSFILFVQPSTSATTTLHTPVLNDGFFFWGAQFEAGSYPTSYIPTVATVTRNADVISKTEISSLIGQTEGTIFTEFNFTNVGTEKYIVNLKDVASSNVISFRRLTSGEIRFVLTATTSSGTTNQSTAVLPNGNYKIAYKYISGSIKIFINGSLLFTLTPTFTFGSAISIIELGNQGTSSQINDYIKQLQLYKTALTDQECINLTTL